MHGLHADSVLPALRAKFLCWAIAVEAIMTSLFTSPAGVCAVVFFGRFSRAYIFPGGLFFFCFLLLDFLEFCGPVHQVRQVREILQSDGVLVFGAHIFVNPIEFRVRLEIPNASHHCQ